MKSLIDHWFDIFAILSSDAVEPFLSQIDFPFPVVMPELRKVARNWVLELHKSNAENIAQSLLHDAWEMLRSNLGEADATLFINWGNSLKVDKRLQYSLWLLQNILFQTVRDELHPPEAIQEKIAPLILSAASNGRSVSNALDDVDNLASTGWEQRLHVILNEQSASEENQNELPFRVTDRLDAIIEDVQATSLLRRIRSSLTVDETDTLNLWVTSQPHWHRNQSNSSAILYQPFDLKEIFELI